MKLCGFDLETTGLDTHTARPVQVAIIDRSPGITDKIHTTRPVQVAIIDRSSGITDKIHTNIAAVEVPPEATAIHGLTTDYAMTFGKPERTVVRQTIARITAAVRLGYTIVGANLAYDLTLLDHAARRHGLWTLCDILGHCPTPVWDVYVIAGLDPKGPPFGSRKLAQLVRWYLGRDMVGAHDAVADVQASLDVAEEQMRRLAEDEIKDMPMVAMGAMHATQLTMFALTQERMAWSRGMRPGDPGAPDPCWPVCHGQHDRYTAPPAPTPASWADLT